MTGLLSLILPIFILISVGFAAVRTRFVSTGMTEALGLFVLDIALPALILHALLQQDLRQTLNWGYLLAYAAGSLVVFAVILMLFPLVFRKPLAQAAVAALGASASNSGFVGFPVAYLALGAPALTALPLSMLVENVVIIPLALALGEMASQRGQSPASIVRHTLWRLARTPLILAILAGIVLSALGIGLPEAVSVAVEMTADAAIPCALFVVGATLAGQQAPPVGGDVLLVAAGKLVLHPLCVGGAFLLVGGVPADLLAAGILLASAPMLTVYPILGARFGHGGMCAGALLTATAASFLTLLLVLGLILPGLAAQAAYFPPP